jgi:hypothetical protein
MLWAVFIWRFGDLEIWGFGDLGIWGFGDLGICGVLMQGDRLVL